MKTHKELVNIAHKWMMKNTSVGVAFKELVSLSSREVADVIGFGYCSFSILMEIKISRKDYFRDKLKPFRKDSKLGMGTQRWYVVPENLIKINELPENWGLIYVDEKSKCTVIHNPYNSKNKGFTEKNIEAEHGIMYSALRRIKTKEIKVGVWKQKSI